MALASSREAIMGCCFSIIRRQLMKSITMRMGIHKKVRSANIRLDPWVCDRATMRSNLWHNGQQACIDFSEHVTYMETHPITNILPKILKFSRITACWFWECTLPLHHDHVIVLGSITIEFGSLYLMHLESKQGIFWCIRISFHLLTRNIPYSINLMMTYTCNT